MRAEDHIHQARSFLDWYERAGGDIEDALKVWARSKDFQPEDVASIWAEVKAPTDPGAEELVPCIEGMLDD